MDGKHKVQIVGFKKIPYTNKKTQAREEMVLGQCVITSQVEEGEGAARKLVDRTVVGELMMPRHLSDIPLGHYLAEFELSVGQDLRIGSRLTQLHPFNANGKLPSGVSAKPAPSQAGQAAQG